MSRIPCPVPDCPMPAKAGLMCGACQAELRRALDGVPALVDDLHDTLSRQVSRMGRGGHGSSVPLPFDERASDAGVILHNALHGWVRQLQELQPEDDWPADTPQSMARWLSARLSRLIAHPAAGEAHGEITAAVRRAQRVTDRPAEKQFAGRCPNCDGPLYAKPGASRVQCRDCDAEPIEVGKQLDQMRDQVRDRLAHPTGAAALLARLEIKAPESTIRRWAAQGRILAHGTDPRGRSLYRIGDILDVITETGRSLSA